MFFLDSVNHIRRLSETAEFIKMSPYSYSCFSLRPARIHIDERIWYVHFKTSDEFTTLLPYIQAVEKEATHFENPEYLEFNIAGTYCALYPPNQVVARFFFDRQEALSFVERFLAYLDDLENQKNSLTPQLKTLKRPHLPDLIHLLPLSNWGKCGFKTVEARDRFR